LIAAHPNAVPPVAFAPNAVGAYVGQDLDPEVRKRIAEDGARTIPGREHGELASCRKCGFVDTETP
jgi:formamidase